ncbi:MAG: PH domain-containing protein [Microbacteriaceae bacterium]|nr:PH domain-containing protein [Microbacteriaceae bacterium]HPZ34764.1 PH domain-containing protein [Microbacteriaceae bacterium]HQC93015.1 PH domain-containing protein [Microbacteriaceae bacterium]
MSTPDPQADPTPVTDSTSWVVDDAGTFTELREPSSPNRLVIEPNQWHQLSRKYLTLQLLTHGALLVLIVVAGFVLTAVARAEWIWIPFGVVALLSLWGIAILPRQVRGYGYQLRQDDLVFRRGILWQRVVAVPYGRMQLIDITHGPLDRGFGIAQLKFVTAAATTGVTIPGLSQATAESLRDHLIAVAESRRTGL